MDLPVVHSDRTELKHQGKWLSFHQLHYTDPKHNQSRTWEYVQRTHRGPPVTPSNSNPSVDAPVDAVEIVAIVKEDGQKDKIVLVMQYRPPTRQYCIEFPAGLVDEGESVEEAAHRELAEETGYQITRIVKMTPPLFYEPGLSNSNMKLVYAHVSRVASSPKLETDEWSLQTVLLPIDNLYEELERLNRERQIAVDAKLYTFAYALTLNSKTI